MPTSTYSGFAAMVKAAIMDEKRRKVQRRKEEALFTQSIEHHYELSHLETIRNELLLNQRRSASTTTATVPQGHDAHPSLTSSPANHDHDEDEPVRCMHSIEMSVRCIEASQGGSSLWSGESDGSIGIRNGVTGRLVHRIAPPAIADQLESQDSYSVPLVDSLMSSGTNMFAGFSDGSVRVYDAVVFALAAEARVHEKSVCAFASAFDERTFSAALDGSLVKWDTDAGNFALMSSVTVEGPLLCLCTYGYRVFAGCDDGSILTFDTDTLVQGGTFSHADGHTSRVNGVLVQDGYLFSCGSDGKAIVWMIDDTSVLKVLDHASSVTAMFADPVGHRLWCAEITGSLRVWSTLEDEGFRFSYACPHNVDCGDVLSVKGMVALDAVKVWSIGSNGVNKVWHASCNRIEEETRVAIAHMKGIVDQDDVELAKWDNLTRSLKEVAQRLAANVSDAAQNYSHTFTRRTFLSRWMLWLLERRTRRSQLRVATALQHRCNEDRIRRAFSLWSQSYQATVRFRRNEAIANLFQFQRERQLRISYAKKLDDIAAASRRRAVVEKAATLLEARTQRDQLQLAFRLWDDYRTHARAKSKRLQLAATLGSLSSRQVALRAFVDWRCVALSQAAKRTQSRTTDRLAVATDASRLKVTWGRWMRAVGARHVRNERGAAVTALAAANERVLMRRAATMWARFSLLQQTNRSRQHHAETRVVIGELHRHIATMDHLLQRRRLLDEADIAIRRAEVERDRQRQLLQAALEQGDMMRSRLQARRLDRSEAVRATLQQQVSDLISGLKCKLTNFYDDFVLVQRVAEKQKKVGPEKVFLESHQTVKRVVVELTHESHLAADQVWPLTLPLIRTMRSHHTEAVLAAIKSMIISYDALTAEQQASMTTDQELAVNVENLHNIADFCLEARNKRRISSRS